ncbi:hypothetical protein RintRC_4467 [Richelia intracellularis]|nr:hypothetical protein RintRC_4467 [Richelia intracellularis]
MQKALPSKKATPICLQGSKWRNLKRQINRQLPTLSISLSLLK